MGQRVVCEVGRLRVCDEWGGCAWGCWVIRECDSHCDRDHVRNVER